MKKNQAFSLIELMVVMAIISSLILSGSMMGTAALRLGRDSKRRADLKAIQNAMEQFYAVNGSYPTNLNQLTNNTNNIVYLRAVPSDSRYNVPYIQELSQSNYTICADLETVGNINNGTQRDLCVTNQQ